MRQSRVRQTVTRIAIAGAVTASVSSYPAGATVDTIKAGGTGSAMAVLRELGAVFERQTGIAFKVLPTLGSAGGLRALADGVIDIAISGNPPSADLARKGVAIAFSGRTPFVLVTSHRRPGDIRSTELVDIYSAKISKWPDGTPIKIILRPQADSDTVVMGQYFPGIAAAIQTARQRADVALAGNDQDNAELAEQTPGSLTAATTLQIVSEKRLLRTVSINGVAPSLENFENGRYPYGKTIHFVIRHPVSGLSERFVTFLRSAEAQQIMRVSSFIPNGKD